jgi:hypothetical protein
MRRAVDDVVDNAFSPTFEPGVAVQVRLRASVLTLGLVRITKKSSAKKKLRPTCADHRIEMEAEDVAHPEPWIKNAPARKPRNCSPGRTPRKTA